MARYIKANPLVAKYLNLENDRNAVKDGNYILWQGDMLAFGPLTRLNETLAAIGAIALMPHEAREEQDGTVTRALPEATDPRFVVSAPVVEITEDETTDTAENDEPQTPAEGEEAEPETTDENPEEETTTNKASKK
ncbi:MAG: hypothetical protein NC403_01320 [Muribaculaceae bacterium]|nr:hypothetical protein [Muribaculaceae bacterium]